jgi:hypothetical protein
VPLTALHRDGAPPRKRGALSALLAFGLITASLTTGSLLASPTAAQAAPDGPAWTCSTYGYLFQTIDNTTDVHSIYQVDLVTGESSEIGRTSDNVNAVGYNTTDDYVYGVNVDTGSMVQVASDGTETVLPDPSGYIASGYNVGDFDDAGHYWTTHSGNAQRWYEIDYAAGSPTYGQVLATGTNSGATTGSDWVFVDGGLYSVSNNTNHLVRFDTSTRTSTDLGALANLPVGAAYGAGYADAGGTCISPTTPPARSTV